MTAVARPLPCLLDPPAVAPPACGPFLALEPLPRGEFHAIRRRMALEHSKWDPQVGDVATLAPFPILIAPQEWARLAAWAEELAAESLAAEAELLARPELHGRLGLARPLRKALALVPRRGLTPAAARIHRFDFHPTRSGWRISEVNSDVPGGFTEASSFPRLMAGCYSPASPAGDPGAAYAASIVRAAGPGGVVALVSAPGFLEDLQVVAYLASELRVHGCIASLCGPVQVRWEAGRAHLEIGRRRHSVDAIVRFYQGEWMASLPRRTGWDAYFAGGATPVANPGSALLVESKRFPLVWDDLRTPLPTWRRLLPETIAPEASPWPRDDAWLVKAAFSNNGDSVALRGVTAEKELQKTLRDVRRTPRRWAAQRRFETLAVSTPCGDMHPCFGVYTVDGKAAGIYGRMSPGSVIDYAAIDVAVLIAPAPPESRARTHEDA